MNYLNTECGNLQMDIRDLLFRRFYVHTPFTEFPDPGAEKLPYPKYSLLRAHENSLKPIEEQLKHGPTTILQIIF